MLTFGRDPDVEFVYFALYYAEIKHAIEVANANHLYGDAEAYDVKRSLGFTIGQRNNLRFTPTTLLGRILFDVFKDHVR